MLVAGVVQGGIGLVYNDNGIAASSSYPAVYIIETLKYVALMAFFGSCFILCRDDL